MIIEGLRTGAVCALVALHVPAPEPPAACVGANGGGKGEISEGARVQVWCDHVTAAGLGAPWLGARGRRPTPAHPCRRRWLA